jgi:hypothetical protein
MQEHGIGVDLSCICLNREDGVIRDELIQGFRVAFYGSFRTVGSRCDISNRGVSPLQPHRTDKLQVEQPP